MNCPFCHQAAPSLLTIENYPVFANAVEEDVKQDKLYTFSIRCCPDCAFGFQENPPRPEELYTRVRAPSGVSQVWCDHYQALAEFALANREVEGKTALDAGAGHGFLSQLLKQKKLKVEALERNPGKILCELGIPIHKHFLGEGVKLPKQFDFVFLSHVLEHTTLLGPFLEETASLVALDGTLVMSVPDMVAGVRTHNFSIFIPEHNWYFSERSLQKALSCVGFAIEETAYFADHSIFVRAKKNGALNISERRELIDLKTNCERYANNFTQVKKRIREITQGKSGRVFFFGAHSMTLNLILDMKLWESLFGRSGFIDNDPHKQGLRLSGTPWMIQSPEAVHLAKDDVVMIPQSPYANEMQAQVLSLAPECFTEIIV